MGSGMEYGVAGILATGMVVVVRLFLNALQKTHADFAMFLGNHMSKHTEALYQLAEAIKLLKEEVRRG